MGNEMIQIGPDDYLAKLKIHTSKTNKTALFILEEVKALVIADDATLKTAKEDDVNYRIRLKEIDEDRKSITAPINQALDEVNAAFKAPTESYKSAREILARKIREYEAQKEAERKEAERRAQEKARQEEERIRKEKEAQERAWREKEAKAREEAERAEKAAQNARSEAQRQKLEAEAEAKRKEAEKAQEKANERAIQAQEAYVPPEPVVEQKEEVKVAGFRKKAVKWTAEVTDQKLVPVEWSGRMLRPVDNSIINEIARALKTKVSPIPGVRFLSDE